MDVLPQKAVAQINALPADLTPDEHFAQMKS